MVLFRVRRPVKKRALENGQALTMSTTLKITPLYMRMPHDMRHKRYEKHAAPERHNEWGKSRAATTPPATAYSPVKLAPPEASEGDAPLSFPEEPRPTPHKSSI